MSALNFYTAYMQLLEHTKYVVQYSGLKGEKDKETNFPQVVTRKLPECGLHFDLFTVHCKSFPLRVN